MNDTMRGPGLIRRHFRIVIGESNLVIRLLRAANKMGVAPRSNVSASGKVDETGLPRKVDAIRRRLEVE